MQIPKHYIVDSEGVISTTENIGEWVSWYSDINNRRVAMTEIEGKGTVYTTFVSTLVLSNVGPKWETMYVSKEESRFWSWDSLAEAQAGHEMVLDQIRGESHDST